MKHFGECFDIRFDYLPNFNISIYRVKSISRMPSLWEVGNSVGWVTQYILYANGRELCRLTGCAHFEPEVEKVTNLCIALAIIDRVARINSTPNRRFQVYPAMMLKPSDLYATVHGFASSEMVERPILLPTSNIDYILLMLYRICVEYVPQERICTERTLHLLVSRYRNIHRFLGQLAAQSLVQSHR